MAHYLKYGDLPKLRWDLKRDLSDVTSAEVFVSTGRAGDPLVIDRAGVVEQPPTAGIVSLQLEAGDFGDGKLEARTAPYLVEVQTLPGPLTHPDAGYEHLYVAADLDDAP